MKKKLILLGFVLASTQAFADTGDFYVGGSYQLDTYKEQGMDSFNPTSLTVRGGYYVADHVAIEAQLGVGASDDTIVESEYDAALILDIKRSSSLFVKAELPVGSTVDLYSKVGYSEVKLSGEVEMNGEEYGFSESRSGAAFGAGLQAKLAYDTEIVLDYTVYHSDYDYKYSAVSLGVNKRF